VTLPEAFDVLTDENRNSSPLTSTLQTPPSSGPLRRLGSVSSRERLGSRTALDGSDRVTHPSSSSASEFPKSMPRPLRRAASELSRRPRFMSRRLHQDLTPTISPHSSQPSSQPSSSTISSALDGLARGSALHMAEASLEREATSGTNLHLSDARWSPDVSMSSSDQLLAFRELLAGRTQNFSTEARSCVTSPDPDQRHPGFGDLCEDVASDCSDYGESILSGREDSLDEPDNLASADNTSTSEDLWRTLSITRTMKTMDSPDNYSLLANDDMPARSSSPTSQLQSESLQPHIDPHPQRTGSQTPVPTVSIGPEALQEFLPNFLDLRLGADMTRSVTDEVSLGADDLHLLQDDERPTLVPEGSSADARGLEGERPDIKLAQQPPVTNHPRRVQSAAELVSSPSPPSRPPLPSQDDRHGHDKGIGAQAEYSELAHSQSKTEPDNLRRGNSCRVKRVQDRQYPNPGLSVAVDSRSQSESRSREIFSVSQRHRAMTLQEVSVAGSSTSDRLYRSATTKTSGPSSSPSRTGGRYRTLEDRAFRHPDVPHSPLFSDLEHGPSAQDAYYTGSPLREPSNGRNPQASSPEPEHIPPIHSRNPSTEVYSRNASPRPPVPRPHMPPNLSRNDSYPARKRPVQGHVRRPGTSLDSHAASSLTAVPPPSTHCVGLSVIDNGAFEAPRPAPEPRTVPHENANAPSRTVVQQVAPAATEEPICDAPLARRDSESTIALSLTSLSGFPRRVWSKRQKQPPPRSDGLRRRLGSLGSLTSSSELDLMSSSFMSVVEDEHGHVKPQRKGLLSFRWK
jgi:hypothetical protein